MADAPANPAAADTGQPKAALHYRQGGDHCGVCMYFSETGDEKGTCPRVIPHDVAEDDLCDDFSRAGRESNRGGEEAGAKAAGSGMAANLAQRGLISDKAMSRMPGGGY